MNDEEFEIADDDDDNEDDETTTDFHIDDGNNADLSSDNDCSDGDEQDDDRNLIDTRKEDFIGIKVHNVVQSHMEHSHFKVTINDNKKYIHKLTACWILAGE